MEKETTVLSYEKHAVHETNSSLASCYTKPESIDAWRHFRMVNTISSLLKHYPNSTILTIGDGNYGGDAHLLKGFHVDVLASSISDTTLKIAKQRGYIDKFKAINAEDIPFTDNSFDFVFCKACYHHFPRPPIAFYEMFRVAKVAVILIEPTDDDFGLIDFIKKPLKKVLRKVEVTDYEPCGNFIFKVNSNELKKMLTAIDKPTYCIRYYNDFYLGKLSCLKSNWHSMGFILTRFAILFQDILCYLKLLSFGKATMVAFKIKVSDEIMYDMRKSGFKIFNLPKNPYL